MTKPTILVVEDEELMRTILRQLLTDAGYLVLTADSAETAVEVFAQNEVAVTLTDIKMAGADGLQLLDQIKSLEPEAVVTVSDEDLRRLGLADGERVRLSTRRGAIEATACADPAAAPVSFARRSAQAARRWRLSLTVRSAFSTSSHEKGLAMTRSTPREAAASSSSWKPQPVTSTTAG